jgi:hypothetical protein
MTRPLSGSSWLIDSAYTVSMGATIGRSPLASRYRDQ